MRCFFLRLCGSCHGLSDVRVFNPLAQTYVSQPLATCYRKHEREKRRLYEQRVGDVEHGCFSPVVIKPQVEWLLRILHTENSFNDI